MKKITFFFLLSLFLIVNYTFAQENGNHEVELFGKKQILKNGGIIRCASTEYEVYLKSKNPNRFSTNDFEKWIAPKIILEKKKKENESKGLRTMAVITIPVVVHIIHNGDVLGKDENIFDEQILSQIQVLNEDYRKKINTPGFNTNPVGADTEIEFALARRDPAGVLTNGINRVNLGKESWLTSEIDAEVKPKTQWNPEKYLNIWVVKLSSTEVLGYAQFPSASGLNGLDADEGDAVTDGVVIGYSYFGSSTYFPAGTYSNFYDKGRTTSHEIGHWLGLRHIWGDGDCTVDDFCLDTPNSGQSNEGCPTNVDSCPSSPGLDMVENYMDYTDDACMNIFTNDQKTRMLTVINNSTRRAVLKTSDALMPGTVFVNDAAITISNLNISACSKTFAPTIKIVNKGSAPLTKATINYGIDSLTSRTYNWTGNLANNEAQEITLNNLTTTEGNHTFTALIGNVNTTTDQNIGNNSNIVNFDITKNYSSTIVNLALQLDEYGSETTWKLTDANGNILYQGGPYRDTATIPAPINTSFNLANNSCYTFTIFDSEQDGFCCQYGNGSYTLSTHTNEIIATGGKFTDQKANSFIIGKLATDLLTDLNVAYLYPNPASNILNIVSENKQSTPDSYTLINILGQIIKSKKIERKEDFQINISSLSQGVYFLKLSKNDSEIKTLRFLKQ